MVEKRTWRDYVNLKKPNDKLAVYIDDAIKDGWTQFGSSDQRWIVGDGIFTTGGKEYAESVVIKDIEEYYRRKTA